MRAKSILISPVTIDANGVCEAQTPAAAGNLLLNGALGAGYDADGICAAQTPAAAGDLTIAGALTAGGAYITTDPRRISITSDADESGDTYTITGTDKRDAVLIEAIAGPNTTIVETTGEFKTVNTVAVSGAGTGNITVGTVGTATFTQPCHVSITSDGDDSGDTYTITGTDRYGVELVEAITGPDTETVKGNYNFATIRKVAVSGAGTGNITLGNADELESQWIQMDRYGGDISVGVTCASENYTYAIQHTFTDIQTDGFQEQDANSIVHATLSGETATANGSYSTPINAMRLAITSFVAGTATIEIIQA